MNEDIRPVEIKDLKKTQLIWLAVLLSFVVSIATGIVTVTLMQQAPAAVTQTINRVVQQTVEKVVPGYTSTTTQTVIVKEDDLVVDAVTKIRSISHPLFTSKESTVSVGDVYLLGSGIFLFSDTNIDWEKTYTIEINKNFFDAKVVGMSPLGFSLLSAPESIASTKTFESAVFVKEGEVSAGQTAITVSRKSIRKGIVQAVNKMADDEKNSWSEILIDPAVSQMFDGALVVNLDGSIIGITKSRGEYSTIIIGYDAITKLVAKPTIIPPVIVPPTVVPPPSTATP